MNNMQSIYCYPNTDVLINHFNIKDQDKLSQLELEVTSAKVFQLKDNPIRGNWDLKHLQEIHKYIFGDIYPFAGEIRNEQIAKGYFQFCSPMFIEDMGKDIFNELKSENFLKGLDKQNMAERLAYYMAEINVLHPFREGNGRTQREFIRSLAMKNGFTIDWSKVDKERYMQASISSVANTKALTEVIHDTMIENEPNKDLIREWEKNGSQEMEL